MLRHGRSNRLSTNSLVRYLYEERHKNMKKYIGIVLVLGLFVATPLQADAAFGVSNGGFEVTPPVVSDGGFMTLTGSQLPGWTIASGGSIDLLRGYQGWVYEGQQAIDLAGNSPGTISQTLTDLTIGQEYTVSFAYGRNIDNLSTDKTGIVTLGAGPDQTFEYAGIGAGWSLGSYVFTATGTSIQLSFAASPNAGSYGALLDAVSITATPEPATIVVWSGLAAIGGIVAYRRKKLA